MLAGLLGDKKLALDVDGKDFVNFGACDFVEVAEVLDACVALALGGQLAERVWRPSRNNYSSTYHDYVDLPKLDFGFCKQPGNVLLVRDVGLDGNCFHAMLLAGLVGNFLGFCC